MLSRLFYTSITLQVKKYIETSSLKLFLKNLKQFPLVSIKLLCSKSLRKEEPMSSCNIL